jgi:tetratricopeptide (TPR) repeat protein
VKKPSPPARLVPLALLLLAALVIKLAVFLQLRGHPLLQPTASLDDAAYLALANRVVDGDWSLGPDVYYVSPLYAYFVALVLAISNKSLAAVRVAQLVLGTVSAGLIFATAREWFGRRAAVIAGVLAALTGLFTFYETLLIQAALDPFLAALALWTLGRALRAGRGGWQLGAGLSLGLLALNRPNVLPFAAVAVIAIVAANRILPRREVALRAGTFVLGLVLAIAPVTVRNRLVAGEWVLITSHGGLNFYIGNSADADGTYTAVPGVTPSIDGQVRDSRLVAERAVGHSLSSSGVSGYFYDRAWAWIRTHPRDALSLMGRKIYYTINAADFSLNYSYTYYSRDERTWLRGLVIGPWLLLPMGLVGWVLLSLRNRQTVFPLWALFIPVYGLSIAVFFVSTRYRLPLLVPLVVTTAGLIDHSVAVIGAKQWRRAVWLAATLVVAGTVTNWSTGPDYGRANEQAEMAVYLARSGRTAETTALLARLDQSALDKGLLYFRVGQAFALAGNSAEGIRCLQAAFAYNPQEPDIRLVLGQALLSDGRYSEAVPHLAAARQAGVAPELAGLGLARAFAEVGKTQEAHAALLRVVDLRAEMPAADWLAAGLLALRIEDPVLAERALRAAIAQSDVLAPAHENLGVALLFQGQTTAAVASLERACVLDPASPSAHYNLAVALAEAGRLGEARNRAEQALRLKPDYPQAKQMLTTLDARK